MTPPDNSPQSPGTPARPPASDAERQAHADERFSRGIVEAENRAAVRRRSAVIIGSVIAVGVLVWLIVTRL